MSLTLRQICLVAEKLQPIIDDLKNILWITGLAKVEARINGILTGNGLWKF
jgi:hypothetical protein